MTSVASYINISTWDEGKLFQELIAWRLESNSFHPGESLMSQVQYWAFRTSQTRIKDNYYTLLLQIQILIKKYSSYLPLPFI